MENFILCELFDLLRSDQEYLFPEVYLRPSQISVIERLAVTYFRKKKKKLKS